MDIDLRGFVRPHRPILIIRQRVYPFSYGSRRLRLRSFRIGRDGYDVLGKIESSGNRYESSDCSVRSSFRFSRFTRRRNGHALQQDRGKFKKSGLSCGVVDGRGSRLCRRNETRVLRFDQVVKFHFVIRAKDETIVKVIFTAFCEDLRADVCARKIRPTRWSRLCIEQIDSSCRMKSFERRLGSKNVFPRPFPRAFILSERRLLHNGFQDNALIIED